jgi:hypothetical protein
VVAALHSHRGCIYGGIRRPENHLCVPARMLALAPISFTAAPPARKHHDVFRVPGRLALGSWRRPRA